MFLGTKLIGANNEHRGITTGALLIARRVDHRVTLEDEETGEQVEVKPEVLGRYTRLRHAITLASCQGRTLRGLVRLWDARSRHMTATHIYVAASRATSGELFECKITSRTTSPRMTGGRSYSRLGAGWAGPACGWCCSSSGGRGISSRRRRWPPS